MNGVPLPAQQAAGAELLMVGASASTLRLGNTVLKITRLDDEAELTQSNAHATRIEANVYRILGASELIVNCLYISLLGDMVVLEFYPNGTLKAHVANHGATGFFHKWARLMIASVALLHSKGVRHADLRLDQWLLDADSNARLSDFNSAGYDGHPDRGIQAEKAIGLEAPSHFLPRDPLADSSIRSDLFALGSALHELESGRRPFAEDEPETITERFARREFPVLDGSCSCKALSSGRGLGLSARRRRCLRCCRIEASSVSV